MGKNIRERAFSKRQTMRKKHVDRKKLSHTRKSKIDISIYKTFNKKCERVNEFAEILLETDNKQIYDNLMTYIFSINEDLVTHLKEFKEMYGVNNDNTNNNNDDNNNNNDDTIDKLVTLSEKFKAFAHVIYKNLKKNKGYKSILVDMTVYITTIYNTLNSELKKFKQNPAQPKKPVAMNEENKNNANKGHVSNDDGLGGLLNAFNRLGL